MIRSAPYRIGCCRYGVVKQLSTTSGIPRLRASPPSQARSTRSSPGFDGVSTKIAFVFGRIRPGPGRRIGEIGVAVLDPPAREEARQDLVGRAEQCPPGQHVVAGGKQRAERHEHRRHPRRRGDPVLGALEQADLPHQLVGVRVGVAAVDVPSDLVGEERPRLLGVVEDEARGEVERHRVLALGRGRHLGPDGEGLEADVRSPRSRAAALARRGRRRRLQLVAVA